MDDAEPDPGSGRPGRPSLLLEQRAGIELATLLTTPVYYGVQVPRGDGAPVLVVPGFLGSDDYLVVLRGWLRRMGYVAESSGIPLCVGSPFELAAQVVRRAEQIATGRPGKRITLIGHSLGGIVSRMAAVQRPDLIAHVVTLGSPLCPDPRGASHPLVAALAHLLLRERGRTISLREARALERECFSAPFPSGTRMTCIYTREDAVADWRSCIEPTGVAEAIEVSGSHTGLAWNARVYRHLGRVLAGGPRIHGVPGPAGAA